MRATPCILIILAASAICCADNWHPRHANRPQTSDSRAAEGLAAHFLHGYRRAIHEQHVPPRIRHFLELSETNVAANIIFSDTFEAAIQLSPAPEDVVAFSNTHVPLQLHFFYREATYKKPFPAEGLALYAKSTPAFDITNSQNIYFRNVLIDAGDLPFRIGPRQLIISKDISFVKPSGDYLITNTVPELTIWTGSTNFGRATRDEMQKLGRYAALNDILDALERIPFFRQAYAHEQLRPDVEAYLLLRKR